MSEPVLELSFFAGIDEATRDELVEPGQGWCELVNIRQDRRGAACKRLGYGWLIRTRTDATSRSTGNRLLCHNDLVLTIDGTYLDAYASGAVGSAVASRVPEVSTTARQLSSVSSSLYGSALANGYIATAALRTTEVVVSVETTDGAVIRLPEVVFTSTVAETAAAICSYGAYFVLLAHDSTTANIKAWYLDTSTAATITAGWQSLGNAATDKTTSGVAAIGLSAQSLSNRVAFVYVNNSGGASQVTVKTLTASGVVETATVNTSSVTPDAVCVEGSIADTLWVAWNESTTVKVCGLDADSLSTALATTGSIGTAVTAPSLAGLFLVSSSTAGAGRLGINDGDGVNFRFINFVTSAGACAASGVESSVYGERIASRPVRVNGRYYALFGHGGGDLVLCDWTDTLTDATRWLRPVSATFPGLTYAGALEGGAALELSATKIAYPVSVRRASAGDAVTLLTFDFAARKRWRAVTHNGSLYLSGGILSYFDGRRVSEASYLHAPQKPTAADATTGSGPNGAYRYVCTFEEMDDDGNWCLSGVSSPSDSVTVTDNAIDVSVAPLVMTSRLLPGVSGASAPHIKRLRVCFYRTLAGGNPPYYFSGSEENDTGDVVTYRDSVSDATLATNRYLYGTGNLPGTGGAAQNRGCPPFCTDVESYNGMLVVLSGSTLYWSGQTVDGEGVWFSPAFYQPIEGDGDGVALRQQDGTLYVFKRRAIYAVAGEAPGDNGTSGGLGTPRRLAVDVGCIDPCSIVVTSLGIFFQSERGIELLGRGGAVTWIGEEVQATLESFPVVSSAVLDDRNGLVRFTLAASESGGRVSGNGRDLVFDLAGQKWQSADDKSGTATAHEASQDAAMIVVDDARRYGWLGTDGTVYYERLPSEAGAYLDVQTWITQRAVSPWVAIAGRNGEQFIDQVLLLAKKLTGHDLAISIAFDFSDSYANTKTFTASQIGSLAREWLVREITQTKSQAVRVKLEDATPSSGEVGTGQGGAWVALTFNGHPHRGPKRTSSAQRGGS